MRTLHIFKALILSALYNLSFRRNSLLLQRCHLLHPRVCALRHVVVYVV